MGHCEASTVFNGQVDTGQMAACHKDQNVPLLSLGQDHSVNKYVLQLQTSILIAVFTLKNVNFKYKGLSVR